MFRTASDDDIDAYSDTVTCFIRKCIEDVVPTKTIRIHPNQKPWINSNVRSALSARTSAFNSGNTDDRKQASYDLRRSMVSILVYHQVPQLYGCSPVGPDGIPGRVLKACAFQLAGVFTDIFNLSPSLSVVPSCFKKSTIVSIPKKNKITCLNDWRPVALSPIFSKCFEKLVREHICSVLPASLDPLQFTYRSNRSIDDAIAFTLHTTLSHLENKNTYVRMLFVDYSSAFNAIVPATLVAKLQTLGLNRSLCSWILDFLTGRSQVVRMGNNTSSPLILNTGAPQGCVLSPLLYSLYTHDCTATHSSNVIVKFADDTTVIGLITDNDETRRCTRKARRIIKDSSHPSHSLLSLLPSGRRFRSIRSRTSRLRDSFFP